MCCLRWEAEFTAVPWTRCKKKNKNTSGRKRLIYEGNYIAHRSMGIKYFHLVTEQIKKKRFFLESTLLVLYLKTLRRFLDAPFCWDTRHVLDTDVLVAMQFFVANKIEIQIRACEQHLWSLIQQTTWLGGYFQMYWKYTVLLLQLKNNFIKHTRKYIITLHFFFINKTTTEYFFH